jgi:hypothetical protein
VDDGFFRFFLPQGTIAQLAVDGFPPGYSLTSVIYGGTNVGQKFLVDRRESLLLMIRVQPGATLPTVTARGKVENLARELNGANLSLVLTATLSGGPRVLAPVQPDHSFEFVNIPIGSYSAGIQSAQSVWRSVTVVVIRDAVSDLKIDFGDDPFPDWDVANLSAPSPFSDGKTITITGVATQKLTRYRPAGKSAYFRMNVKDEATGVVKPWAIHITDEGLVPNIAVGETYTLTGSAAADGSNRLKAQPF